MKRKTFLVLAMIVTLIITSSCAKQTIAQDKENIDILNDEFAEGDVEISFPQFSGLKDIELQNKMNALLKDEAFREYENSGDLSLSIKYEIIYQDDKTISVIYSGFVYNKYAAYPRDIFTTINIDLESGDRIQLNDVVKIDKMFVEKLRETLSSCIDENPDWEPVYSDKLNSNNEHLLNLMLQADSEKSSDCFSYFTQDYLGISFSTAHVAGDHFEVKMMYSDIEEHIK